MCDFHAWELIERTRERTAGNRAQRIFRCSICTLVISTPVSRDHEITWKRRRVHEALPDQLLLPVYGDVLRGTEV